MKVEVSLFGAFRDYQPAAAVTLEVPAGARVADLRSALAAYGRAHWPGFREGLLLRSAFASQTCVLGEQEVLPESGPVVVLPPVGGG
ncbi:MULTISPECIES: MoaD/ThiS family protein [Rhodanobacter]|uniref:MoaD/ThiS family protein n=1 Tax=Rhodanobacter TaxID=75309 RepID=UPI000260E18B|nr:MULTISPECIES: MoaD/ThiS family protein [Rhodanobacter]EIM04542.1 sulfur transfer protein ThiS [Rhodanobacter denitrificans]KZC19476.1 thiamine biosynthesis protein ThiS [Rhodanobacter denitrificans]UJJ50095.1 MoaD/ThiS family protein [Rhodanobacter denitrificans]UJJ57713.1 MoaD/ThiS family protein [Rhodanobacter denitrificans]UJM91586.1 MoaD/ThiS family protein [Rhodanobacter denitrificans]